MSSTMHEIPQSINDNFKLGHANMAIKPPAINAKSLTIDAVLSCSSRDFSFHIFVLNTIMQRLIVKDTKLT